MRLNALWVEGRLGYIERLCLSSALQVGHDVVLYTYGKVEDIPYGVDVRDGSDVMPDNYMIKYTRRPSYALGSNRFRYFLQKQGLGCYIDCDVLFLKPIDTRCDYIFGFESEGRVNSAVLKLPVQCDILEDLLQLAMERPVIPPWWPIRKKLQQWARYQLGKDKRLEDLEWGLTGPTGLTYYTKKHGAFSKVQPIDVFYPNPHQQALDIFDPEIDFGSRITERTVTMHLWNEIIKSAARSQPPAGCFIHRECERLGISWQSCNTTASVPIGAVI